MNTVIRYLDEIDQRRGFAAPTYKTRDAVNRALPNGWRAATFPEFYGNGAEARWTIYDGYPQDTIGSVWLDRDGHFICVTSSIPSVLEALTAAFEGRA